MIDKGMLNFMKSLLERNGFNVAEDNLKFQVGNSKLNDIITFSLPAGHSCPFAQGLQKLCGIKRHTHDKQQKSTAEQTLWFRDSGRAGREVSLFYRN